MAWLVVVLLVSWLYGVGSAPDLPSLEDDDVHGYLMFSFCTCSLVFNFYLKKTHVITQTRDIVRGVLVGNEAKEAKIQKYKATYM